MDALPQQDSERVAPASALLRIPDHELLRPIASGSYGEVWLARNVMGELRAVKIIHRSRFNDARPFEREFEGIRRFEPISRSHPSQLAILHVGKNDAAGCFYYVMELADPVAVDVSPRQSQDRNRFAVQFSAPRKSARSDERGYSPRTLRHDLECHGRLPISDCVQIGLSLTTALAHLHQHGLVHRDIKPSNVIFVNGVAKLGDIGLVTEVGDTKSIVGTEGYIPPEGPGTPQGDIFSLGKVLYEVLTGLDRHKFPALPDDLPKLPERRALLEFNEILLKACAHDARQRYASAEAMSADLERIHQGKSVRWQRSVEQSAYFAKRAIPIIAVVVTLFGLWWLTLRDTRRHEERSTANVDKAKSEELYRKARAMTITSKERFAQAVVLFNEALAHDPNHAPSHSGLANVYVQVSDWLMEPKAAMSEAKRSATTALKLDPNEREGLVVMGCVKMSERDWAGAEADFKRAMTVDKTYARARFYYASLLRVVGRMKEARELTDKSLRLQPKNGLLQWGALYQSCVERHFDRAIAEVGLFSGADTNRWSATDYTVVGWAAMHSGRSDDAIGALRAAQSLVDTPWVAAYLAWALGKSGHKDRAAELVAQLERLSRVTYVSSADLALAYMGLGDHTQALDRLAKAVEKEGWCGSMLDLLTSPAWDEVRSDARFKALLEKLNLPSLATR